MAGSVNKAIIIGNLGQDPEVRHTQNGNLVVSLSVATSESWRDKQSGERKEKTEWHRVVIFQKSAAEFAERYLRKGNKVYLEGPIRTRKYEGKDGQPRYTTEIVIEEFRGVLQSLESAGGNRPPAADSPDDYGTQSGGGAADTAAAIDDEIPF